MQAATAPVTQTRETSMSLDTGTKSYALTYHIRGNLSNMKNLAFQEPLSTDLRERLNQEELLSSARFTYLTTEEARVLREKQNEVLSRMTGLA